MRMCRLLGEAARPNRARPPAILKLSKAANLPRATVKLMASRREPRGINDPEDQEAAAPTSGHRRAGPAGISNSQAAAFTFLPSRLCCTGQEDLHHPGNRCAPPQGTPLA